MQMKSSLVSVVDTETTGQDPEVDEVIELGVTAVDLESRKILNMCSTFVRSAIPIKPEARAAHHISDEQISKGLSFNAAMVRCRLWHNRKPTGVRAAFNAKFDEAMVGETGWLCIWRLARHLWPNAPKHSNQALRYWLGVDKTWLAGWQRQLTAPHRAGPDSLVSAALLLEISCSLTLEEMFRIASMPFLIEVCPLKKWRDTPFEIVADKDPGYLRWIADPERSEFDEDMRYTARYWLEQR